MEPRLLTQTATLTNEEWLNWRKMGIGGSDAAVVCGISRWKSPMELWLEKTGQAESRPAGEAAYWGHVMEPVIRSEFSKRSGLEVKTVQAILQHPEQDFMLANVDGLAIDPVHGKCLFEAKTANSFAKSEWDRNIPAEYMLQIQHYLHVMDLQTAYVAALIGGNHFLSKVIEKDQETISMLVQLEQHFWNMVKTNTPPSIDGSDASNRLLDRLYPGSNKVSILLPDNAEELICEYLSAKNEEDHAKAKKQLAENQLKDLLGENETGQTPDGHKIAWKAVISNRLDSKALKADHPDLVQQYSTSSSSRRFTVA